MQIYKNRALMFSIYQRLERNYITTTVDTLRSVENCETMDLAYSFIDVEFINVPRSFALYLTRYN